MSNYYVPTTFVFKKLRESREITKKPAPFMRKNIQYDINYILKYLLAQQSTKSRHRIIPVYILLQSIQDIAEVFPSHVLNRSEVIRRHGSQMPLHISRQIPSPASLRRLHLSFVFSDFFMSQ